MSSSSTSETKTGDQTLVAKLFRAHQLQDIAIRIFKYQHMAPRLICFAKNLGPMLLQLLAVTYNII